MMHAKDLVFVVLLVVAGCTVGYAFLMRRLRQIVFEHDLRIADRLGTLDVAIQALETRLTEHHAGALAEANRALPQPIRRNPDKAEGDSITGEIKAVIAAAASAVVRKNAAIKSIRSVPAPWTQQGRVLVLGSHNLRVRQ